MMDIISFIWRFETVLPFILSILALMAGLAYAMWMVYDWEMKRNGMSPLWRSHRHHKIALCSPMVYAFLIWFHQWLPPEVYQWMYVALICGGCYIYALLWDIRFIIKEIDPQNLSEYPDAYTKRCFLFFTLQAIFVFIFLESAMSSTACDNFGLTFFCEQRYSGLIPASGLLLIIFAFILRWERQVNRKFYKTLRALNGK